MKININYLLLLFVISCNLEKPLEVEPILFTFESGDDFAPTQVRFYSELEGISSYNWNFGDGSPTTSDISPTHTYLNEGNYSVILLVTNNNGKSKTFTTSVEIKPITFEKSYGTSKEEVGKAVLQLQDGGYLICGETENGDWGGRDILVIKVDKFGNKIQEKHFGTDMDDYAYSMIETTENDFMICGFKAGVVDRQVLAIRFDINLNQSWIKSYGDPTLVEIGKSICQLGNGDFVICGQKNEGALESSANTYLLKIDENGEKISENGAIGSINAYDIAHDIQLSSDNSLIITGQTDYAPNSNQIFLAKRDLDLNETWAFFFGGVKTEIGLSLKETFDKGFVICGITESFGNGNHDIWVIKTNKDGLKTWDKTFGYSEDEDAYSIQITKSNDFIIGGTTSSKGHGGYDALLLGMSKSGDISLEKYFGGAMGEIFYSIQETSDEGFVGCGFTESFGSGKKDIYLVKTDKNGNL